MHIDKPITQVQAAIVIYSEIMDFIEKFNKLSEQQTDPDRRAFFELAVLKQVYSEEIQKEKNLYGSGSVQLKVKLNGLTRSLFHEGFSFRTKSEMENENNWTPKLMVALNRALLNAAFTCILAMNPDDPAVEKVIEETKKEIKKKRSR